MASVDVKEIISKQGIDSVNKTTEALEKSYLALQDNIVGYKALNDVIARSKGMTDMSKNIDNSAIAQEKLKQAVIRTEQAEIKLAQTKATEFAKEEARQAKLLANEQKQIAIDNAKIARIKKHTQTIISDSQAEVDAYNKSVKAEGNYIALGQKAGKTEALLASQSVALSGKRKTANTEVTNSLSKQAIITEEVGKRSGNVFQKIFSQVRNLAYILPGVGIAGLFGLALDPLFSLISGLDIFKVKLDQIKETRKQLINAQNEGTKSAQSEITTLKLGIESIKNLNIPLERRKEIYKEQQQQYPAYLKNFSFEEVLAGKADKAYQLLTGSILATARARAFADKITANTNRQLDNETLAKQLDSEIMLLEVQKKRYQARAVEQSKTTKEAGGIADLSNANRLQGEINDKIKQRNNLLTDSGLLTKQNEELDKRAQAEQVNIRNPKPKLDKVKDNSKELEKNARDSAAALTQIEINASKEIQDIYDEQANNQFFSLDARLNAVNNYTEQARKTIQLGAEKELVGKQNTAEEEKLITEKLIDDLEKLDKESGKRRIEITKQNVDLENKAFIERKQLAVTEIEKQRDEELTALISSFQKEGDYSEKAQEKLEADRLQIIRKANLKIIDEQVQQAQKLIEIRKLLGFDTTKLEADLSALVLKGKETELDGIDKTNAKRLEKEKQNAEKLKEVAQAVFDFSRELTNGIFEANISNLEAEKEARQKNTDLQIENVNESMLSEKEKADQTAVLTAQGEQQQAALDAKIREQKRKQAIADKAFALAQIAINTAVAISKELAFPFLIPGIIALGAIQAATVLAQPIPKFAKGGVMQKDGLAEYGHGVELRLDPDGKTSLTKDTPEIGFVKKGTRFISAPETKRLMGKPDKYDIDGKSWDISGLIAESQLTRKEFKKAINSISVKSTIITEKGFQHNTARMNKFNSYISKNFSRR